MREPDNSSLPAPRQINCPSCGNKTLYAPENRFRPFCSARCKNIDIGAWASEHFRVPAEAPPENQEFGDPKLQ